MPNCPTHPAVKLVCPSCQAERTAKKLGREHFADMGRKSRKPKNEAVEKLMREEGISRETAYRRLKKLMPTGSAL